MAGTNVYKWTELPREQVREGVSRTAFRGEGALMVMNWLEPGMEKKPHSHPFEQLAYILSGRVRFEIGDDVVEAGNQSCTSSKRHSLHAADGEAWMRP